MRIKWVDIKNFRSIAHTAFNLADGVSAFAGGNESGKSNVLLAIEKFLNFIDFLEEDRYQLNEDDSQITIRFNDFTQEEETIIREFFGDNSINEIEIQKIKGNEYELVYPLMPLPAPTTEPVAITSPSVSPLLVASVDETNENSPDIVTPEMVSSQEILSEPQPQPEPEPQPKPAKSPKEVYKEKLLPLLPHAVMIDSIGDLIIGHPLLISELYMKEDEFKKIKYESKKYLLTVKNLLELGGITQQDVQEPDISKRTSKLESGAAKISKILDASWRQEDIKLRIASDTTNVVIQFRDGKNIAPGAKNDPTKWIWTLPQHRSYGFRWYVTFYVKYLNQMRDSGTAIFLIDDVGAPLNKKAQEDLLKEFQQLTEDKRNQILYVTHSKDMVDWDIRNNIYCITKKGGEGTKVVDLWWEKFSRNELPSPLDELGVTWTSDFLKQENLILEGITDVIILHELKAIFSTLIPDDPIKGYKVVSGGGVDRSIEMAMLCKVHARRNFLLFDSDSAGLRGKSKARDTAHQLNADDLQSLAAATTLNLCTIEDLLPHEEFLEALNIIGKEKFPDAWKDIAILHRVRDLGVVEAVKKRLETDGFSVDDASTFIKNYKYDIAKHVMASVSLVSFERDDKKTAIVRLFTALNLKL
jgi:hypothetical protein